MRASVKDSNPMCWSPGSDPRGSSKECTIFTSWVCGIGTILPTDLIRVQDKGHLEVGEIKSEKRRIGACQWVCMVYGEKWVCEAPDIGGQILCWSIFICTLS